MGLGAGPRYTHKLRHFQTSFCCPFLKQALFRLGCAEGNQGFDPSTFPLPAQPQFFFRLGTSELFGKRGIARSDKVCSYKLLFFHFLMPEKWGIFQYSKQAARPSARIVAAPSAILVARLRNVLLGFLADRPLGLGKTDANRAACLAVRSAGPVLK